MAIQRLDLTGDDPPLPDRFLGDANQPQPLQAVQITPLNVHDDQCPSRVHVLFLGALAVLGRLDEVPRKSEIVDTLGGQQAGGIGREIRLHESAGRRDEPRVDPPGTGGPIGIGIDLGIVEGFRLIRSRGWRREAGVGFQDDRVVLQSGFDGLLKSEEATLVQSPGRGSRLGAGKGRDDQRDDQRQQRKPGYSNGCTPSLFEGGDTIGAGADGRPADRRSNFWKEGLASGKAKGETWTAAPSNSLRLPTTTTSSSPWRPWVISIHLPLVMPVCTGTDLALPCSTMNTDLPFGPLMTACGGRTSALGISRTPMVSSA